MLKMILVGGLAISILCFFMAQNEIHRDRNKIGYLSSKYGPPAPSEFYDYPPSTNDTLTSTEPYFRIILSKKSNISSSSTSTERSSSTTEVSEYFNDVYDDDYKEGDFQNLTQFPFLNGTTLAELQSLLNPHKNGGKSRNSSKTNFETTTIHWSRLIPENDTEVKPDPPISTKSPSSTPRYSPTSAPSSSVVTKVLFQTTTVKPTTDALKTQILTESTSSSNVIPVEGRRDYDLETVGKSQIDSQGLSPLPVLPSTSTTFVYENAFSNALSQRRMEESLTESTMSSNSITKSSEDLSYLPQPQPPPSAQLSLPESMPTIMHLSSSNSNLRSSQKNVSQPSRLYLPPNQN